VLERLRANLGLKAFSLAIALGVWAYLRLVPNPVVAARFVQTLNVPISTTGLKADSAARYTDKTAVVTVVLPRTGEAIRPDEIRAVLDLDGRSPGVYNVPIELIAPKLEIRSLSPASVTLSIERIEERGMPVVVRYVGDVRRKLVRRSCRCVRRRANSDTWPGCASTFPFRRSRRPSTKCCDRSRPTKPAPN
jgi:hypothetical protein